MKAKPAVLFDLDGTLLDTLQDLATSGNEVVRKRGFPPHELDAYRVFIGNGMKHLVKAIFPEGSQPETAEEIQSVLQDYREAYARNWTKTTDLFPGTAELLDHLVSCGIAISVVSNKAHDFTVRCVDQFLSDWEWKEVIGHREGRSKKPDPEGALEASAACGVAPENCFFIGDSDVDMQTAVAAGMRAIGVSWGMRSAQELREHGAERVIDQPSELIALL